MWRTYLLQQVNEAGLTALQLATAHNKFRAAAQLVKVVPEACACSAFLANDGEGWTPLARATYSCANEVVQGMLDKLAPTGSRVSLLAILKDATVHQVHPLDIAVMGGQLEVVAAMLREMEEDAAVAIQQVDSDEDSGVLTGLACLANPVEIGKLLFRTLRDQDTNLVSKVLLRPSVRGETACQRACTAGRADVVGMFITEAGDAAPHLLSSLCDVTSHHGNVQTAAWQGNVAMVKLIMEAISKEAALKLILHDTSYMSVCIAAASHASSSSVLAVLLKTLESHAHDSMPECLQQRYDGHSLLVWAVARGHVDNVKLLLEYAKKHGVLPKLLAADDDVGHIDTGLNIMHHAAFRCDSDVLEVLVGCASAPAEKLRLLTQKGIETGLSPLHAAATSNCVAMVCTLCDLAKDPEIPATFSLQQHFLEVTSDTNQTAFHLAVEHGHDGVVEALLNEIADISIVLQIHDTSHVGWTPLDSAAAQSESIVIEKILEKLEATPDSKVVQLLSTGGGFPSTTLNVAAEHGNFAAISSLLGFLKPCIDHT
jgi:ankyrin repeat protein